MSDIVKEKSTAPEYDPQYILQVKDLKKHFPIKGGMITKTVGHVKAVDGVTFNLKRGTTMGLVGESGCGKTTAGRTILRLAGEKTEESFGTLAGEKTEDTGSKSTGGLYTGVKKGDMVAEFDAWCFDEVRVVGDYGIVKTQYGYHIMYFSGSEDIWYAEARNAYISDESNKFVEKVLTAHPIDVDFKKIVLAVVKVG